MAGLALITMIIKPIHASALDALDPSGALYTGISDNSHFNDSYTAANLFNHDMTAVAVGTALNFDSTEYARQGPGTSFITFQLDQIYTNIASIFFANRSGTIDAVSQISIWSSASSAFTAVDPGTAPDSLVAITNTGAAWKEYLLTNTLSGQYFLLRLDQSTPAGTSGSNPGGKELRLGQFVAHPPLITSQSADKIIYSGGVAHFKVQAIGPSPLYYKWLKGASFLTNGINVSGADTAILTISSLSGTDEAGYTCIITNAYGSVTSDVANLSVVPLPADSGVMAVLSNFPVAYWQLDETAGGSPAVDMVGGFNGTYGSAAGSGVAGPRPPDFKGFSALNTAVQTYAFETSSIVTMPALNLTGTNGTTITAWIYPNDSDGPQNPYTGIVFSRDQNTVAGLICSDDGTKLAYQWGATGYQFDSGLVLPSNQWCMVSLVYTPSQIKLYCSTNDTLLSAVDNSSRNLQTFRGITCIGLDTDLGESLRTFNGSIDEVAIYDHALTGEEINAIFAAGKGAFTVTPLQITTDLAPQKMLYLSDSFSLSAVVSGTSPRYQWYKNDAPIFGATNNIYGVSSAKTTDSGNYYLVAYNQANSVTSSVATVAVSGYLARPLDPSGTLYIGISDDSHFNDSYTSANLFDYNMTGVAPGTFIDFDATEYARQGGGSCYVAFQLDHVYTNIGTLFYSQRYGASDAVSQISLWTSDSTPFTAADPGTEPDSAVTVTNTHSSGAYWDEYYLTNMLSGRYFLLRFDQTTPSGNPGGRELRLGILISPAALTFMATPTGLVLNWSNGILEQADNLAGPWATANGVSNGVPISTTATNRFYRIRY